MGLDKSRSLVFQQCGLNSWNAGIGRIEADQHSPRESLRVGGRYVRIDCLKIRKETGRPAAPGGSILDVDWERGLLLSPLIPACLQKEVT